MTQPEPHAPDPQAAIPAVDGPASAEPAARTHQELRTVSLGLGYDGVPIVTDLDLAIAVGRITVIVGANASGKSTLLRGLARLLTPQTGVVLLDGTDIATIPGKRVATVLGLLPQQPLAPEGITVGELVGRGRHPHQGWFRGITTTDEAIVADALVRTGTLDLAARRLEELSGGQRQRVWIAMALAQDTDILLLDEPTSFLDVAHQLEVLDLLLELNRTRGTTIVMVLHDLNLAARYADEMLVMRSGGIIAAGPPADTLTVDVVRSAFGLDALVIPDPVCGSPLVVPIGRFHPAPTSASTILGKANLSYSNHASPRDN